MKNAIKSISVCLAFCFLCFGIKAQQIDHGIWDTLLQQYVSVEGRVDYEGFQQSEKQLDSYLLILQKNEPSQTWSKEQQLAYWINVYNAWTVKTILEHYPVASILDIDAGETWKVKRVKIGEQLYSLDEVENEIIRPRFKEPRIHFAVNCAAKSCPPLWNQAFTAENLEKALEQRTQAFINHSGFNTISQNKIMLSKIFEWYILDFGDVLSFLQTYSLKEINTKLTPSYIEYDWRLNK